MAGYIGVQPVPKATQRREYFTAGNNQTTFNTSGYTPDYVDVYMNGVKLSPADFTATNGSDVVLASGAATGDLLQIISFLPFQAANQAFTGTFSVTGAVDFDSTLNVDGATTLNTTLTLSDGTDEFDFGVTTNQLMIKTVTSDGSDDQRIIIDAGNGGQSSTRGAYVALSGNEASSEAGKAIYQMGNVTGASHVFRKAGGLDAVIIDSSGNTTFSGNITINTGNSGVPAINLSHSNANADNFQLTAGIPGVANSGFSIVDADASANRLVIDTSGNVGIAMTPDSAVKLSVSGAIGPTNGSNSAPTHTFYSDSDTGMYRSGANSLSFTTGGSDALTINSSQNASFNGDVDSATFFRAPNFYTGTGSQAFKANGNDINIISQANTTQMILKNDGCTTIQTGISNVADEFIFAKFYCSVSPGNAAGILIGGYPADGYAKQGIFLDRYLGYTGNGGRGDLLLVNKDANDTSVPTSADAKIRITPEGHVGIGEVSASDITAGFPDRAISTKSDDFSKCSIRLERTGGGANNDAGLQFTSAAGANDDTALGGIWFQNSLDDNAYAIIRARTDDSTGTSARIEFVTGTSTVGNFTTPYVTITSGGSLLVGSTLVGSLATQNSDAGLEVSGGGRIYATTTPSGHHDFNKIDDGELFRFREATNVVGGISVNSSSTSYATSSDYRLKENVVTDWDATSRLKQLKPSRFNWKIDKDTIVDGFLAHEVSSIVPEAVTGVKDGTRDLGTIKDKDGKVLLENVLEVEAKKDEGQTWTKTETEIVYQGIDQSKLVPLLVKTIQELEARITALEAK